MSDFNAIVVATVHGEDLSLHEFLQTLKLNGQLATLLSKAVVDKLVRDLARREGIAVTDRELQQAADQLRARAGLYKAEDTGAWLARNRLSVGDLETLAERTVVQRKLRDKVTQGKVEAFFDANRSRYDRARAAHLVVDSEGLASELLCQIRDEGRDFTELARQHSLHEDSRQAGGRLGLVQRKNLNSAVAEAIFNARPSTVVGPVKTDLGYHLILVQEVLPAQLDDRTADTVKDELFLAWLQEELQQAKATVKLYEYL
jgi:putative peptide maturation system protein